MAYGSYQFDDDPFSSGGYQPAPTASYPAYTPGPTAGQTPTSRPPSNDAGGVDVDNLPAGGGQPPTPPPGGTPPAADPRLNGPAAPVDPFGMGGYRGKLEGFDLTKLGQSLSPKYQFGRTFSRFDPKGGISQALLDALNALGLGTVSGQIGGDKIRIGGQVDPRWEGVTEFDVIRDLEGGGGWQWGGLNGSATPRPRVQPGQAGGGVDPLMAALLMMAGGGGQPQGPAMPQSVQGGGGDVMALLNSLMAMMQQQQTQSRQDNEAARRAATTPRINYW